jgi:hypothetical protein
MPAAGCAHRILPAPPRSGRSRRSDPASPLPAGCHWPSRHQRTCAGHAPSTRARQYAAVDPPLARRPQVPTPLICLARHCAPLCMERRDQIICSASREGVVARRVRCFIADIWHSSGVVMQPALEAQTQQLLYGNVLSDTPNQQRTSFI